MLLLTSRPRHPVDIKDIAKAMIRKMREITIIARAGAEFDGSPTVCSDRRRT
jgi:hypothetical protein